MGRPYTTPKEDKQNDRSTVVELFDQGWPDSIIEDRTRVPVHLIRQWTERGEASPLTSWDRVERWEKENGHASPARKHLERHPRRYPKF